MGSSFTGYRGHGFWARDGILATWLEAIAEVVPGDAPPWLRDAQQYWRDQARAGFLGCINADLDTIVSSADRAMMVLGLADEALALLVRVAAGTGHVPATWLSRRHVGGEDPWCRDLDLDYPREVARVFTALLRGELLTIAATSPVIPAPTPGHPSRGQ
jgi:hypothetical protein